MNIIKTDQGTNPAIMWLNGLTFKDVDGNLVLGGSLSYLGQNYAVDYATPLGVRGEVLFHCGANTVDDKMDWTPGATQIHLAWLYENGDVEVIHHTEV